MNVGIIGAGNLGTGLAKQLIFALAQIRAALAERPGFDPAASCLVSAVVCLMRLVDSSGWHERAASIAAN